ncbi:MAG: type II secretion system protein [bacterium]|nr:type II secretion system protein [bacterium]
MKNRFRAFTLIELLVVIAIIGILSSIILTNLNGSRQKARDVKRVSDVKQLQLALALYYDSNNGKYPRTLASGDATELAPTYIPAIPTPPGGVSGAAVSYLYVPIAVGGAYCNSYHLGTALEVAGNSVLTSDSDAVVGIVAAAGDCGGAGTVGADFKGVSALCNTTDATDQCFDVTP